MTHTTTLHGKQIIAGTVRAAGRERVHPASPLDGGRLDPAVYSATADEVDEAAAAARSAWPEYRSRSAADRATFLRTIAANIEALSDVLVQQARKVCAECRPLDRRGLPPLGTLVPRCHNHKRVV